MAASLKNDRGICLQSLFDKGNIVSNDLKQGQFIGRRKMEPHLWLGMAPERLAICTTYQKTIVPIKHGGKLSGVFGLQSSSMPLFGISSFPGFMS